MKQGWEVKKLGEVCEVVNGGTPKTGVNEYWDGDFSWITPAEMGKRENPYVSQTERKITDKGLKNSSAKMLPPKSVILSSRAPIGHLVINTKLMATNQGCKGLIPNDRLNYKYLFYYLGSKIEMLNNLGSGATFKELSGGKLKEIPIPIASLLEQQRIVSILDECFTAIAKAKANAEQNLKNAKELFESYLQSVFQNKGEGWEEKALGEVCIVERGSSPRPIDKYFTEKPDGVNWIKIGDTKNVDKYIYSTKQKITKEGALNSRFVDVDDFLLSNSMSFGKPYIMKTQGYIHDGWFVLRLPKNINTEFFWYLLASPFTMNQFTSLAAGAIVKNISGNLVKKTVLPIPPLRDQLTIVQKLDTLRAETQKLEAIHQQKISDLEELKKSILQKAFSGELKTAQDIAAA